MRAPGSPPVARLVGRITTVVGLAGLTPAFRGEAGLCHDGSPHLLLANGRTATPYSPLASRSRR
jgi:hypothetical protein